MGKIVLSMLAFLAASPAAQAAEHYIKIDGYCDRLKFKLIDGRAVGFSNGKLHGQPCDNDDMSGTVATTATPVTPTGQILTLSTDLGQAPAHFVYYIDLNHGTYTLYGTADGNNMFAISGTWSDVIGADTPDTAGSSRRITDRFFSKRHG